MFTRIPASNTSSITNSLLGKVKSSPLPSSIPLSELPQRFSDFFHRKVTSIRRNLDSTTVTPSSVPDQPFCGTVWGAFPSVSVDEVKKLLKHISSDPCLDDPLPHLTSVINDSLHSGLFPSALKSAIVESLLKKITQPRDLEKLNISVKPFFHVQNPRESCSPPALGPSDGQQSIVSVSLPCRS